MEKYDSIIEEPCGLQVSNQVEYRVSGKVAAKVDMLFLGGKGYIQHWGNVPVGSGKALVHMNSVLVPGE